jgi:hypothetical protein
MVTNVMALGRNRLSDLGEPPHVRSTFEERRRRTIFCE